MTSSAIIMMIVALVTVWGGLAGAIWHHARHAKDYRE